MPQSAQSPISPELVFGLVGPIGTDFDPVTTSLHRWLTDVDYKLAPVLQVIELLQAVEGYAAKAKGVYDKYQSYRSKMDAGNEFCKALGLKDALAALCIYSIQVFREDTNLKRPRRGDPEAKVDLEHGTFPLPRYAYILKSLKRPQEVKTLRRVYGDSFFLIAVASSLEKRRTNLARKISETKNLELQHCWKYAEQLIERDAHEGETDYGQRLRNTFHLADVFIDADDPQKVDDAIRRLIRIIFGHRFETPTKNEYGMCLAHTASLRSSDMGRQVGAAICCPDGQIMALGCNDIPKAHGGLYWEGDSYDKRDFKVQHGQADPNIERKRKIFADLLARLRNAGLFPHDSVRCACGEPIQIPVLTCEECHTHVMWPVAVCVQNHPIENAPQKLKCKKCGHEVQGYFTADMEWADQLGDILNNSKLWDITEYGRSVHAEMAAILDAVRKGIAIGGATLFTTTFPCHNCAKHMVAAGVQRVIYIEPYPKSQVSRLYDDSIAIDSAANDHQIQFEPFVGIAPRRYHDFFDLRGQDRRVNGKPDDWETRKKEALPKISTPPTLYSFQELGAIDDFNKELSRAQIQLVRRSKKVKPSRKRGK